MLSNSKKKKIGAAFYEDLLPTGAVHTGQADAQLLNGSADGRVAARVARNQRLQFGQHRNGAPRRPPQWKASAPKYARGATGSGSGAALLGLRRVRHAIVIDSATCCRYRLIPHHARAPSPSRVIRFSVYHTSTLFLIECVHKTYSLIVAVKSNMSLRIGRVLVLMCFSSDSHLDKRLVIYSPNQK